MSAETGVDAKGRGICRILIVTTAVLCLTLPAGEASARTRQHCAPPGAETIEMTRLVRVYRGAYKSDESDRIYACSRRTGRRFLLGIDEIDLFVRPISVAGTFVAYYRWLCDRYQRRGCSYVHLDVLDLRRKVRRRVRDYTNGGPHVDELVVRVTGSIAWIEVRYVRDPDTNTRQEGFLWKKEATGETFLDSGIGLGRPRSLTLSGSTLTWTKHGEPRSATLH